MGLTLNLMQLMGNTEETNVLQACPTTGQVLCFSPKLFFFFLFYGHYLIFARFFEIFA